MAGDDAQFVRPAQFGAALRDKAMARAVEAIPADAILRLPFTRHRVADVFRRHVVVKRRLEGTDARQARMRLVEAPDGGDVGWVVRGQEGVDFLHRA